LVGQQFCRSCGFNLEKVAELLSEQPQPTIDANLAHAHLRQRRMEHWAGIAGLAMTSLLLLTVIYLVITEMIIRHGKVGVGLLLLIMFLGGAVMTGLQGYSKALKHRLSNRNSASIKDLLHAAEASKQLEPHRESVNSVTEHTTELLPAQPPPRRANTKEI
jgi:DNA-binding transcriptional MerR regulator